MQIKNILLVNKENKKRIIEFELSSLNIITGASKKGKSSLLEIVEYCLGSSTCGVAKGHITQTVKWYATLFQLDDTQVLIARKAPEAGENTNNSAYLDVSNNIDLSRLNELEANTNISDVVDFLSDKIGLVEQKTTVPENQTRNSFSISFKHSKFFLFQGQDEIANKRTLFHRQSEQFIPQVIKDVLPYFIGAAEDDRLSKLETLRVKRRERTQLVRELHELESLKGNGLRKAYTLVSEAISLGLISDRSLELSEKALYDELRKISTWQPEAVVDLPDKNEKLISLEAEFDKLSQERRLINFKLKELAGYQEAMLGYQKEQNEQALRLKSVELFKRVKNDDFPFKEKILFSLSKVSKNLEGVTTSIPKVNSHFEELKAKRDELTEKIRKLQKVIQELNFLSEERVKARNIDIERAKVVGRISFYTDGINIDNDTTGLEKKIERLQKSIDDLEAEVDPELLQEKLDARLNLIGLTMSRWAKALGLEHSEHPIKLDLKRLTVVAETPDGKVPLDQMGSGENWVGYHLITYLALAKWFVDRARPVPRFVFFDQPSQVYFPTDLYVNGNLEEIAQDEDRVAVRKMFKWFYEVLRDEFAGKFQIIITDHADIDEEWYQSSVIDEKWRGDKALIPKEWVKS